VMSGDCDKPTNNDCIKPDLDKTINFLERQGVSVHNASDMAGLGDMVESALSTLGITEERFKDWFNLQECNCSKRKAWLNKVFSWKRRKS